VSGFTAAWLGLREPFDAAARAATLVTELRAHVARGTDDAPLAIVDLGAGAGSNLRYLAPLLGGVQRWRLVDHDSLLLDLGVATTHAWATARGAGAAGCLPSRRLACDECKHAGFTDLAAVDCPSTGSSGGRVADLVSRSGRNLGAPVPRATVARADLRQPRGRARRAEDTLVLSLFNRHNEATKGSGRALIRPGAAGAAEAAFEAQGYELRVAPSDWVI
jgi:hypothetical protein